MTIRLWRMKVRASVRVIKGIIERTQSSRNRSECGQLIQRVGDGITGANGDHLNRC